MFAPQRNFVLAPKWKRLFKPEIGLLGVIEEGALDPNAGNAQKKAKSIIRNRSRRKFGPLDMINGGDFRPGYWIGASKVKSILRNRREQYDTFSTKPPQAKK